MFDAEIVRAWSLDVRKMVRPERSGVLANLVVYAILWGWGYALVPHDFVDGFSLKCYLAPWECPKHEERVTVREIEEHYHINLLASGKRRKKNCVCRYEVRHGGEVFSPYPSEQCDSLFANGAYQSDWHRADTYMTEPLLYFEGGRVYPTSEVFVRYICN